MSNIIIELCKGLSASSTQDCADLSPDDQSNPPELRPESSYIESSVLRTSSSTQSWHESCIVVIEKQGDHTMLGEPLKLVRLEYGTDGDILIRFVSKWSKIDSEVSGIEELISEIKKLDPDAVEIDMSLHDRIGGFRYQYNRNSKQQFFYRYQNFPTL